MTKVIVDKTKIETFLTRGVASVFPDFNALRAKLESGQRIRVYQGFDPTGPYLHIGHAIGIRALRILQELGHEVIFLVGDYTAKVGDPDRESTRKILTDEEIRKNMEGWKRQAARLVDFEGENPVQFKHNYEWLSKLKLEHLIKLMSHATVQQMVERDNFQKRLSAGNPIQLQEFIYPLMQGYDSVAMEVDLQIGGTDQIFNMLIARQIVKAYLDKEMYVRANVMMDAPDGRTMSKTRGNGINLSDPPETMYGKAMSYDDEHILIGLELLTDTPLAEIAQIKIALDGGENPMTYKKIMAKRIVETVYGKNDAERAERSFESKVQKKEVGQDDAKEVKTNPETTLLEFLKTAVGDKRSSGDIKRMIEQGGVEINGVKITNAQTRVSLSPNTLVRYGKREFFRPVSND